MRNIKLTISYDGTDFHGWQRQPDYRTVQEAVEQVVEQVTCSPSPCTASSRTDAGVHARGQVCHFLTASSLPCSTFVKAFNALLPADVRVVSAVEVPQSFHATLDARSKRYRYVIDNARVADPFLLRYSWHVFAQLDAQAMNRAAQFLVGRHDFRSFETDWPNRTSSVRTILDAAVTRSDGLVQIDVEADGFLYNMVRCIAGTLVKVGAGQRPPDWVRQVIVAQDRREAGPNAPPQGLFLLWVNYGDGMPQQAPPPLPA